MKINYSIIKKITSSNNTVTVSPLFGHQPVVLEGYKKTQSGTD
jgi:hypothetical protein